ncbi:MAG: ATPase, partial [Chryseobacterium sp.]
YEDFVRGIVAKPDEDGSGVVYAAENKLLALFAKDALDNYQNSKGEPSHDHNFLSKLNAFVDNIREQLETEGTYRFGDKSTAQIIAIKEDGLLYNFPAREEIKYKVLFTDLEKVFAARDRIAKPIDLRDLERQIGLMMRGKYPYYYMLMRQLEAFSKDFSAPPSNEALRNYVLIIDEINRANLSAVLGELIYALEYRGKGMDSMYAIAGNHKIVLPPNLLIIGTMNSADRSVGHIDYAIRRRFAFLDVLPDSLEEDDSIYFNQEGFDRVSALFNTDNLSNEFELKDVQLGHSYFIAEKKDAKNEAERDEIFALKMSYEVVPILLEYVKDGVLIGTLNNIEVKKY